MVVFIMEDDLLLTLDHKQYNDRELSTIYNQWVNWLLNEVRKIMGAHVDYLPLKSRRRTHIVWILPSKHCNYQNSRQRKLMGDCLLKISKLHEDNMALELKQIWDPDDFSLFYAEQNRFTNDRLNIFWRAVDRTIRFADAVITKKLHKSDITMANLELNIQQPQQNNRGQAAQHGQGQSQGQNTQDNSYRQGGRKLPPPPARGYRNYNRYKWTKN